MTIQGPPGRDGKDGEDGEDGAEGQTVVVVSAKVGGTPFTQVLDFMSSVDAQSTGDFPENISRVVIRVITPPADVSIYGKTETGEKIGAFGTVALMLNDVPVQQYTLNRFEAVQLVIPQGLDQLVQVLVKPQGFCRVAILDELDRWQVFRVEDPENLPPIQANLLN